MSKMSKAACYFLLPLILLQATAARAQGYQALHGSAYTGSTSVFNNPASVVHSVHKWELTLLSAQVKSTSNIAYLQQSAGSRYLVMNDGYYNRFGHGSADAGIMNMMYRINDDHAIAANLRMRSYLFSKALPFNYQDASVKSMNDFFIANRTTPFLEAYATSAAWLEGDLTYAKVLSRTTNSQLSGGITLQLMKNVAGGFAKLNKFSFTENKNGTDTVYQFNSGHGAFAYAQSLDASGPKEALKLSPLSVGLSVGVEYLVYNDDISDRSPVNYNWKLGVSIMDLGAHSYKASTNSRQFADPRQNITDAEADRKFSGAGDVQALSDSVASLFNTTSVITNNFSISQPTRMVINVDKKLQGHFYVNGELAVNFYATSSYQKLRLRELNLLTITPRWETLALGAYLPIQYNTQGQFWVGAAVKLGPLVAGIHNLGTLLKKEPGISGGGYLLLSIHPFGNRTPDKSFDCR